MFGVRVTNPHNSPKPGYRFTIEANKYAFGGGATISNRLHPDFWPMRTKGSYKMGTVDCL